MKMLLLKKSTIFTLLLLYVFTIIASVSVPFLFNGRSSALTGSSAAWIDNWRLSYGGETFTSDNDDNNWYFYWYDDPDGCEDFINDIEWDPQNHGDKIDDPSDDDTDAKYVRSSPDPSGGCSEDSGTSINLTDPTNATTSFVWAEGLITSTYNGDDETKRFLWNEQFSAYTREVDNNCVDTMEIGSNPGEATIILRVGTTTPTPANNVKTGNLMDPYGNGHAWLSLADYKEDRNGCYSSVPVTISIGNSVEFIDPDTGTVPTTGESGTGGTGEFVKNCENEGGENSWLVCPFLRGMDSAIGWLDSTINALLVVPDSYYESEGLKGAWQNMRDIAYLLLIPIMLVMVIGTALGFSFVDAYTVKKALPRMLVAIIFISLSYDIVRLMTLIINGIGLGMGGLIAGPFGGIDGLTLANIFSSGLGGSFGFVGLILAGVAAGVLGFGILGSFALVGLLTFLTAFILLSLRQVLLVVLAILAPLAILSWIFPGNDKFWKLWWGSFSKLLLFYPIIIVILVTGRVFATLANDISIEASDGNLATTLIKFVAYVGPFFFIPKAFSFAGGALAGIAGMANNASNGIRDRQKKYRQRKQQEGYHDFKTGNRTGLASIGNGVGRRIGVGAKGRFGIGRKGQAELASMSRQNAQDNIKNNAQLNDVAINDDDAAAVLMGGDTRANARATAKDLEAQWTRQYIDEGMGQAEAEATAKKRAGSAFSRAQLVGFNDRNSRAMEQLVMQNKARSIDAGDPENIIGRAMDRKYGAGTLERQQAQGGIEYHARAGQRFDIGGIDKAGLYQLANADTKTIKAWGDDVMNSGDTHRMAVHLAELRSMQPNTTGTNRDEVNDQIAALEGNSALQAYMNQPTGTARTTTERVDYNSDPALAASFAGWTAAEKNRGWRAETKVTQETRGDLARKAARAYEPPDPNRI